MMEKDDIQQASHAVKKMYSKNYKPIVVTKKQCVAYPVKKIIGV